LLELVFSDAEVRRFYRAQRRRQLDTMAELRVRIGAKAHPREDDAVHLFTAERTCDAIAQGELRALGLRRKAMVAALVQSALKALA
jgi:hypothetical protein